jgi:ABC-type oligopeptide transport system substrate-binding subunit
MAIDRDVLVTRILGRGEAPAYGWVPPGIDNYASQSVGYKDWTQEKRVAEARRLYEEAGYGPSNPVEIELRYNTMGGHEKVALAVQAMWRDALGFETRLVKEELKVMLANIQEMEVTQVFRLSWAGDYNDAYTFLQLFEAGNPQNLTAYSNPRVDKLLSLAATESDRAARRSYLEEVERISLEDHPVIPLYFYVTKHMVAKDIDGWAPMPLDYHYSRHLSRTDSGAR